MLVETSLLYLKNKLLTLSKMYVRLRNWGSLAGRSVVFRFSCPLAAVPALVFKENKQNSNLLSPCEIRQNSATRSHFQKLQGKEQGLKTYWLTSLFTFILFSEFCEIFADIS